MLDEHLLLDEWLDVTLHLNVSLESPFFFSHNLAEIPIFYNVNLLKVNKKKLQKLIFIHLYTKKISKHHKMQQTKQTNLNKFSKQFIMYFLIKH